MQTDTRINKAALTKTALVKQQLMPVCLWAETWECQGLLTQEHLCSPAASSGPKAIWLCLHCPETQMSSTDPTWLLCFAVAGLKFADTVVV